MIWGLFLFLHIIAIYVFQIKRDILKSRRYVTIVVMKRSFHYRIVCSIFHKVIFMSIHTEGESMRYIKKNLENVFN